MARASSGRQCSRHQRAGNSADRPGSWRTQATAAPTRRPRARGQRRTPDLTSLQPDPPNRSGLPGNSESRPHSRRPAQPHPRSGPGSPPPPQPDARRPSGTSQDDRPDPATRQRVRGHPVPAVAKPAVPFNSQIRPSGRIEPIHPHYRRHHTGRLGRRRSSRHRIFNHLKSLRT